ncbi:MAG: hypothetical protein A2W90_01660 [Bacteroidetes bacterium GWF2_42_66]|nr:MAG: hypothetical protein A2W92_11965 [Bacteroidetes bacterium GWA2_42_15]OFY01072.1 MAG: hypothetical protein A2W89_15145 [Bacteroidetes bacterium GWE2_42_39]OFY41915.1 MAG: hypothetical protein A2W90_01660 [Bacteroidetes bacterium GWF2_42_66]HBL77901.1 hypothetical protein [Prolixibacteraceae bacterium]HCU63382.1 hypothetical protein [Prolixibacteraceae bacterium]
MKNVFFAPEVGAGTVGGSITGFLMVFSSAELLQTVVGSVIATLVSFGVSIGLKWVIKRTGPSKSPQRGDLKKREDG